LAKALCCAVYAHYVIHVGEALAGVGDVAGVLVGGWFFIVQLRWLYGVVVGIRSQSTSHWWCVQCGAAGWLVCLRQESRWLAVRLLFVSESRYAQNCDLWVCAFTLGGVEPGVVVLGCGVSPCLGMAGFGGALGMGVLKGGEGEWCGIVVFGGIMRVAVLGGG